MELGDEVCGTCGTRAEVRGSGEVLRGTTTVFPGEVLRDKGTVCPIGEELRGTGEWLRCITTSGPPASGGGEGLRADAAAEELLRGTLTAETARAGMSKVVALPITLVMEVGLSIGARREDGLLVLEDSTENPAATSLRTDADLTGSSTADADPRIFCADADLR